MFGRRPEEPLNFDLGHSTVAAMETATKVTRMTSIPVLLQRLAPMHLLTRLAGRLAECRAAWVRQLMIRAFMRRYRIDLADAVCRDPAGFANFNAFFARHLRAGARPIEDADWTSPADGTVSQIGFIRAGHLLSVKQVSYSAEDLLADDALAKQLSGGRFATVYLNPGDYHRVHMPCDGRLLGMRHIPGSLYSVRPELVESMPGLLARNERLVCWFEHPRFGVFAIVLVGAAIVGSIGVPWHGVITSSPQQCVQEWQYLDDGPFAPPRNFKQGQEIGWFQLGSTVIVLMPEEAWKIDDEWQIGAGVRMGQKVASLHSVAKRADTVAGQHPARARRLSVRDPRLQ